MEDPDQSMGYSALAELATWPNLEESGYQKLSSHEAFQPAWIRKALWGRAVRDVNASRLTPESCDFYLEAGNAAVQSLMLDFAGISRNQIERLTVIGKTRAVRNMAAARLRMGRWRKMGAVDARV